MKKLLTLLFMTCIICSCSDSNSSNDDSTDDMTDDTSEESYIYDAPSVRSYVTYTSQNSVTLNGFIDHSNIAFPEADSFKTGFIFREGDENDASNDLVIDLDGEVDFYNGLYYYNHAINALQPNTTYYYTATTKNGPTEEDDWESFVTSSEIPCTYTQDNYVNIAGVWQNVTVEIIDQPICCEDGNVGFRFGTWPNTFEVNFNEIDDGYPNTGQFFGVDYVFDITYLERELVKSTNQVLIGSRSTPETSMFVENDGQTITLTFCNTMLRNGESISGKISVAIP